MGERSLSGFNFALKNAWPARLALFTLIVWMCHKKLLWKFRMSLMNVCSTCICVMKSAHTDGAPTKWCFEIQAGTIVADEGGSWLQIGQSKKLLWKLRMSLMNVCTICICLMKSAHTEWAHTKWCRLDGVCKECADMRHRRI